MSGPQELHITFNYETVHYDIYLIQDGNSDYSVTINGVKYAILGDKEKLSTACEILNSTSSGLTSVDELQGRLTTQSNIFFPQLKKTEEVSKEVLKPFSSQIQEHSQVISLVKNMSSEADIKKVCLKFLALHNNHPSLALDHLKEIFHLAGRGAVSEKIAAILFQEASNRNVKEIRAFGREKTVEVACFLKTLPLTKQGAIDLTQMKKIGEGGTQDVYVLHGASSPFVVKVVRATLDMNSVERSKKYKADKSAYQTLHDSFGDHCTIEQLLLRNVSDGNSISEALISVAAFEEGYSKDTKIGLNASDFEWEASAIIKNLNSYEKLLKSLFISDAERDFDMQLLKENIANPNFKMMVDLIERDSNFCNALKIFLAKFKDYFNKTGQYLDIAGKDNIIFFQTNNGWVFKLGTVIKNETASKFSDALEKLRASSMASEKQDFDNLTFYCFSWTKTLNLLGMMVGMGKVIDDNNLRSIGSMWSELKHTGLMGIPSDPIQVLKILEIIENYPAEELFKELQTLEVNSKKNIEFLEENAKFLLEILMNLSPEKKLVLASYLHEHLPKAGDSEPNYKFCPIRFEIGMELKRIKDGKDLARACLEDVRLDPNGPLDMVQKVIGELAY